MDIAHTSAAERIARVIAGYRLSANADGSGVSAGQGVDAAWRERLGEALAVLNTLREPDEAMAATGDPAVWARMIDMAIARAETV